MSPRALALALLLAWPVQPLDDAARDAVQAWRRPALERPMRMTTELGRPLLVAAAVAGAFGGAAGRAVLAEAAVALVPVNAAVELLKWGTWRVRPDGTRRRANASFPSSHAANAFAVAVVLSRRWKRAWPGWFALAALVAASRVYLNRHWLSDVVAGALLGALWAWWALRAWQVWRARRAAGNAVPVA